MGRTSPDSSYHCLTSVSSLKEKTFPLKNVNQSQDNTADNLTPEMIEKEKCDLTA